MKTQGFIRLIQSADTHASSVMELNILPGEKTPRHYHTLFSETFEILKGTLEVGVGKNIHQLKQGDIATIKPKEKHYYHNVSQEECIIKAILNPGNKNFENSLFILKGLAKDGLASAAGTPGKFSDLALFVYLNNSKMGGIQKIAEPLFNWVAKAAIKKGRLDELIKKYCGGSQLARSSRFKNPSLGRGGQARAQRQGGV
jgi:quercetin dioxygenase-like cupin family protein